MKVDISRKQGDFIINTGFSGSESGVTALYGPSGAGKTSVIHMVSGLITPDRGHISVKDLCLFDSEKGINLPTERRRIGYVFQAAYASASAKEIENGEKKRFPSSAPRRAW